MTRPLLLVLLSCALLAACATARPHHAGRHSQLVAATGSSHRAHAVQHHVDNARFARLVCAAMRRGASFPQALARLEAAGRIPAHADRSIGRLVAGC